MHTLGMLKIIIFLLLGSAMAYLAQDNFTLVTLHVGTYIVSDIPLFYIIIASLLTGLSLGYIINIIYSIFAAFTMHRKNNTIKHANHDIVDLTKRIHQLELENEKLKNHASDIELEDKNAL